MIRKNLLLCKIFRIKTSSKSLFDSYMAKFQPHLETCPICGSTGNCHIHDYYGRSIIDFQTSKREKSDLCVMRVFCDSCEHAHAILPDVIIPYSSYSLLFILRLLGQYFAGRFTIEQLCERYQISTKQFYKWLSLWKSHKQEYCSTTFSPETGVAMNRVSSLGKSKPSPSKEPVPTRIRLSESSTSFSSFTCALRAFVPFAPVSRINRSAYFLSLSDSLFASSLSVIILMN